MNKKEKRKSKASDFLWIPLFITVFLIAAVGGYFTGDAIARLTEPFESPFLSFLSVAGLLLSLFFAFYLWLIVHEAGHLLFGLLTGYRFRSFRIGGFMWIKTNGKIRFRRLKIAGTGGQCLLSPPPEDYGKKPVVLYNLGGSLLNLFFATVCGVLAFFLYPYPFFFAFFLFSSIISLVFALINGIPLHLSSLDNDGYNAYSLRKNPAAIDAFYFQMRVNDRLSDGARLKELPDDWFLLPTDAEMQNSMLAAKGVFCANRMMDAGDLDTAFSWISHLLSMESGITGLHRSLLECDRLYLTLLQKESRAEAEKLYTKELSVFMKSMKSFPSVIRTQYAIALLSDKNEEKAASLLKSFERAAARYPYPADILGEKELITRAQELSQASKVGFSTEKRD